MAETFRLKVASRRQVTMPDRMLSLLHLAEGDMLEIEVEGASFQGRGLKLVPTTLFTSEMLEELQKREQGMDAGRGLEVKNTKELLRKLSKKEKLHAASQT